MKRIGLGGSLAGAIALLGCLPGAVAQAQNESWTGAVVIESVGTDQILVAVDSLNEGRSEDGIVDRVFWYTAMSPIDAVLSRKIDKANLELGAGVLRVTSPDDPSLFYLFSVREWRRDRNAWSAGPLGNRANVFQNGLALATYSMGPDASDLNDLRAIIAAVDTEYQDYTPGGSGGGTSCTSGGAGSTSCSISCGGQSCSVSCGAGFSCCSCSGSSPSCRCN